MERELDRTSTPGYMKYAPATYQVYGPDEDFTLDKVIALMPAGGAQGPLTEFWVKTPIVRCRTRVVVFVEPVLAGAGSVDVKSQVNTTVLGTLPTLWVVEQVVSKGDKRAYPPVRNIVGTGAAPLAIPTDSRLWGYAFELETAGTDLYARLQLQPLSGASPTSANWRVQVRYESVERLTQAEWSRFLGQMGLRVANEGQVTT